MAVEIVSPCIIFFFLVQQIAQNIAHILQNLSERVLKNRHKYVGLHGQMDFTAAKPAKFILVTFVVVMPRKNICNNSGNPLSALTENRNAALRGNSEKGDKEW